MSAKIVRLDPLLGEPGATEMVELCQRFGSYGMYSSEHVESDIGRGLAQRHDAVMHFLRTGGRSGRGGTAQELAARTNYFREEYAYGTEIFIDGIETFLLHDAFTAAAREIHGRRIIEPAIVYANILVPGQELTVHTDVPEFRGANRKVMPQWLIVAMHHSGLFVEHRIPIATAIAWFHDADGGELAFFPDGPSEAPVVHTVSRDTAMVLDTDSVFHGVDQVRSGDEAFPDVHPGMTLDFVGEDVWALRDGETEIIRWPWKQLRYSVSWKAYCFEDDAERAAWREHTDDLSIDDVVATLVADLRDRGRITSDVPGNPELGLMIIDEYIRFPEPKSARA